VTWRAPFVGLFLFLAGLGGKQVLGARAGSQWPVLQQFTARIGIEASARRILFDLPLVDIHGVTKYTLNCAGGDDRFLEKLAKARDINYVGLFACRLNEGNSDTEDSLLSEDDSPYWFSRGQIHDFQEIIGACGRYPEYGAARHFRLRGFELTLEFTDITLDRKGNPTHFVLAISVRTDPTAFSAEAEQTGYPTPYKIGRSCENVLRGNAQRMCRDWLRSGGSWTQCTKLDK
jgi:hypothetical protein